MENKKLNNEGFSLIELIVVIAIMAILAGVLALNLPKFAGSAKSSVDVQLADSIKNAVEIALVDPDVTDAPAGALNLDFTKTDGMTGSFGSAIANTLGYDTVANMVADDGIRSKVKSMDTPGITVAIDATHKVTVTIGTGSTAIVVD